MNWFPHINGNYWCIYPMTNISASLDKDIFQTNMITHWYLPATYAVIKFRALNTVKSGPMHCFLISHGDVTFLQRVDNKCHNIIFLDVLAAFDMVVWSLWLIDYWPIGHLTDSCRVHQYLDFQISSFNKPRSFRLLKPEINLSTLIC